MKYKITHIMFIALYMTNCASNIQDMSGKNSLIEGVGTVELTQDMLLDKAIITAKQKARAELARQFRNNVTAQTTLIGDNSLEKVKTWSNRILYNSKIAKVSIREISNRKIVQAYAYIPKGTNSPYIAAFLSLTFPSLGHYYIERPALRQTTLGLSLLGGTVASYYFYNKAYSKYLKAENVDDLRKYYDNSKPFYAGTITALSLYSILTLYSAIDAYRDAKLDKDSINIFPSQSNKGSFNFTFLRSKNGIVFELCYKIN